jgi:hypothetical protein
MTWLDRWLLKWIFRKAVTQGYTHDTRITECYEHLANAAKHEFREDSRTSLHSFLEDCFNDGLRRSWPPNPDSLEEIEDLLGEFERDTAKGKSVPRLQERPTMWGDE